MISKEKLDALNLRMQTLKIHESDLEEKFVIGSGKGGQKKQKSSTCVILKHIPSNIQVRSQHSRSRADNRFFARRLLCEALEKKLGLSSDNKFEKIRKQKKRRSRRSKQN